MLCKVYNSFWDHSKHFGGRYLMDQETIAMFLGNDQKVLRSNGNVALKAVKKVSQNMPNNCR